MRVVVAPDAAKGSATAVEVAAALARGWRQVRPDDEVVRVPLADGGEGTAAVMAAAVAGAVWHPCRVTGPDGRPVDARWLELPDGTGVVELAAAAGLPLLARPAPRRATTAGVGELLAAALDHGVRRLVVTLGGSATVDGAAGALTALGARFLDVEGAPVPPGGAGLTHLAAIDVAGLRPPPPGGVELLVDVDAPLLGPRGAARVFGPQKGADADEVALLDGALATLAARVRETAGVGLEVTPATPGTGAAGGAAYGLAALWGARLRPGAVAVADLVGLAGHLDGADLVVTGEGRFDESSLGGKVVGTLLRDRPAGLAAAVVAGQLAAPLPDGVAGVELAQLAGGPAGAMADPGRWLEEAGRRLARRWTSGPAG